MSANREQHIRGWLTGRLPEDWFTEPIEVTIDREEITVIGALSAVSAEEGVSDAELGAAESGRIREFRERTRDERIAIARELEHATGQKVAWGAICGNSRELFTTLSVPVMTRLRQPERQVLDTLVDAGVARTRSEALSWCVKLVGEHEDSWLTELREALRGVERIRAQGPDRRTTGDADTTAEPEEATRSDEA